jgi:hypothetical protein
MFLYDDAIMLWGYGNIACQQDAANASCRYNQYSQQVDLPATVSLLSAVPSTKNYYLEDVLKTCTLYFIDVMIGGVTYLSRYSDWLDDLGSIPSSTRFFFPQHSDWLWGPPSLLSNGYQGLFPQE